MIYNYFFYDSIPGIDLSYLAVDVFARNRVDLVTLSLSNSVSRWNQFALGNLKCADRNGSVIFNDSTKSLNYCFIISILSLYSLLIAFPSLYRIQDLRGKERGPRTSLGKLNVALALSCPTLWILHAWWAEHVMVPAELISILIGYVVAFLHYMQDGRIAVCTPELLLYWSGITFGYALYAIDFVLRLGWKDSYFIVLAAVISVNVFLFEITNSERKSDGSYEQTSLFSKISISFGNKTLKLGQSKAISQRDIPPLPVGVNSFGSCHQLESYLALRPADSRNRLIWALKDLVGFDLFVSTLLSTAATLTDLLGPQVMILYLRSLADPPSQRGSLYKSYYVAVPIGILPIIGSALRSLALLRTEYARSKSRAALVTLIYRRTLSLSPKAKEVYDVSKITNLISVDSNQIFSLLDNLPSIIALPLAIAFSLWQLWTLLGPSFLAAAAVYLLTSPIQGLISRKTSKLFPVMMKVKDKRNKLTSNALRCIKSLKLYAWEVPYFKRICEVRDEELRIFKRIAYLFVGLLVTMNSSSRLVSGAIFTIYLWIKRGPLSPDIAFPALTLLGIVSEYIMVIPVTIVGIQQSLASQERVNELLKQPSRILQNYERNEVGANGYDEPSIIVENSKISWDGDLKESKIALNNISFEATRGELICIIGRVGSGKTAILRALCGDLSIISGSISLRGSLAVCTQDVWLQNTSLRENILFGEAYNEKWYKQVLRACELTEEVRVMNKGDHTNIGERGISLSGGQKARVALARAVYSRADIFLLDDVLSAVDEHVGAALIKQIFSSQGLLANRTVILATNNMKILSHSSRIIALENKMIAETTSFKEALKIGNASLVFKLVKEFGHTEDIERDIESIKDRKLCVIGNEKANLMLYPPLLSYESQQMLKPNIFSENVEEEGETTNASLAVYWRYYFLDKPWLTWLILFTMALAMGLANFVTVFLGRITAHNFTDLYDARYYILVYFSLIFVSIIIMAVVFTLTNIAVGLRNSKILHEQMLWSVLRAPMGFFDKTPVGKLINRFTGDISRIDNRFADTFGGVARCFISLVLCLVGILIGSPHVLLILAPIVWIVNNMRKMYVPTRRKVTRIFVAANSPILSHVEDSLKGQLVIGAFNRMLRFIDTFDDRVDYQNKASFFQSVLQKWLQFRVATICAILSFVSALGLTHLVSFGLVSSSYAGVVLSFAKQGGTLVGYLLDQIVVAETSSISLERIFEFIDMPQEAPDVIESTKPDKSWPSEGNLTFNELSAKYYGNGPEVLRNLNFKIRSGEKIGVVGRTGSGKSTLALTIFRMLEASQGSIELDRVDTSILGLSDLRSKLSIVPQDAQLFDSTVRDNLDPFGLRDDAELWDCLEKCELKEHFQSREGLDTLLTDSAGVLSSGQRQLLCLGRALVQHSKILLLDEATASVDHETDKVMQETIRKQMFDRTVITIAHRLNTIMDSDRIMVLDDGEIKEFNTPEQLLKQKGLFYKLLNAEHHNENHNVHNNEYDNENNNEHNLEHSDNKET